MIISVVGMPLVSGASTVTVKPDGTGDYSSIDEAVSNAPDGATINVTPGVYKEAVDVTVSNLTIQSSEAGETVTVVAYTSNDTDAWNNGTATGITLGSNVETIDKSTITVDPSASSNTTIGEAVNNSDPGTVISIKPGTYNETVNVTTDYLVFKSSNASDTVTISAENASDNESVALDTEGTTGVIVGDNVETVNLVLAGGGGLSFDGGFGSILSGETAGIPNIVLIIVVLALAWVGYDYYKETEG